MLCSRASPKNFHEVTEDSHSAIAENKHHAFNLLLRHDDDGENPSGDPDESRHDHFLTPTFRVCDQHREITTRTKYRNGISKCKINSVNVTIYLPEKKIKKNRIRITQVVDKRGSEIGFHI